MEASSVILVLLALGGFGAQPNPAAPPAAEVLRYAPDEADVVAHLDLEAVVPRNYEVFKRLPSEPSLRDLPDVRQALTQAVNEAEKTLAEAKAKVGIDLIHDVRSVTFFMTLHEQGPPEFLIVGRGRFANDFLPRVSADMKGQWKPDKVEGRPALMSTDGMAVATVIADGTLLVGTPPWVKARAGKWAARPAPVTAEVRAALDEKPIFLLASRPRAEGLRLIEKQVNDPDAAFLRDFLTGQLASAFAVSWNGVWWSYTARGAEGYQRAMLATDGMVQLMRAGQLALRGTARVGLALVDSYAGNSPALRDVAARKADLLRIVDTWSGDGTFTATVDRKETERRVSARLTGKSLSEVMPVAGFVILGAVFAVMR